MARPLRIEYPGAFYHVTSRGNRKLPIFFADEDRRFFLGCLRDAHERFGVVVHVYCLMENHYHLFAETPQGQLSRIMHLVNTRYSTYFNKKHDRCGHTFQSRFKAILVEAEEYARDLAPYIHLNPVRAKIVALPEDYAWSNYREYLGLTESQSWTSSYFVLSCFGGNQLNARREYQRYVLWRLKQNLPSPLEAAKPTGILGTSSFVEQVKRRLAKDATTKTRREIPQLRKLKIRPDLATILAASESSFGSKNKHARRMAIFIAHKNADYTLKQIGDFFEMGISGISNNYRKMKRDLVTNEMLARIVEDISRRLFE